MRKRTKIILGLVAAALTLAVIAVVVVHRWGPKVGLWITEPSPQRYGEVALEILDRGLNANTDEWRAERSRVEQAIETAATIDDVDALLDEAVTVAGTKHSFLMRPDEVSQEADDYVPPTVTQDGPVATVTMPAFGAQSKTQEYADIISQGLAHSGVCAAVIDLSENHGGDMGPMIAGISSLIPDGHVSTFVSTYGETPVEVNDGTVTGGGSSVTVATNGKLNIPVAIVTSDHTASSGEQTLLAFAGMPMVHVVGQPTAGYATVNQPYPLYGGRLLVLTVGETRDRTGIMHGEEPIAPDEIVDGDAALGTAQAWAAENAVC